MAKKEPILARIKRTRLVRAAGRGAVAVLNAREEKNSGPADAWHRSASAWGLERVGLLDRLSKAEVDALASDARIRTYPRRSVTLFDDADAHVCIVLEGGMKLCRMSPLGRRMIEALLSVGDVFGRMSTQTESVVYEIQALEPTRVAVLAHGRFQTLLRGHPELAYAVVQDLEVRQRKLVRRIESLVFKDVHMRVAETLVELARDEGEPCAHGFVVDVRITQQDVAELVGASRQMVNRVLGDLERRLYIQRIGRVVCVLHRERLERFAAYSSGDSMKL